MKGSGMGSREGRFGSADRNWLREQIQKHRDEITRTYSAIEGISGHIEYLYNQMKTAKGPEKQKIYEDIQKYKVERHNAHERIKELKSEIEDIKAELNSPFRR